ncbi:threonylcarbamoyl-AMP synthase [Malaya genurostris]|uniref:threonylcarbamoyl-AMP synthase n=1 Tax=Malaya genurostris TaxID=325434 RepID=UPI0026F3A453|nr:threonylcarbamoyl-AMP synthase [Malaya genurostris]
MIFTVNMKANIRKRLTDLVEYNVMGRLRSSKTTNTNVASLINIVNCSAQNAVKVATELLEEGKVIALPTDTVYGLACSANNKRAIQRLYAIKERDMLKPVAICVAEFDDLQYWGDANHIPEELLKKLLPGPVTIVVNKSHNLDNPKLNPGKRKIGIRIPDSTFISEVSMAYKKPIALTSANRSSEQSTLNIQEFSSLWPKLGAVFDGGQLGLHEQQRAASTVIDLSQEGYYKIIRYGVAGKDTIRAEKDKNMHSGRIIYKRCALGLSRKRDVGGKQAASMQEEYYVNQMRVYA